MNDSPIIELSRAEKWFHDFRAVEGFDLSLHKGEFFSLLGPSGCGKTTVLRMIAGFQEPTSGTIRIDGHDMRGIPANRRPTNMVFQSYAIFPHLSVGDNVGFGLAKSGLTSHERKKRIAEALELVGLSGFQKRKAQELSGGQRQRVALARALIMKPKVLLLDEPLSALDKNMRETMQLELRRLQQSIGITFVMVTHDQYEAMTMSDRIGVMFNGQLKQVDSPSSLYAAPANREVASFIGGMNFLTARVGEHTANEMVVDVRGLGRLVIPADPNTAPSDVEHLVGIRPEQIEISSEAPEGYDVAVRGSVTDVAFYGASIRYHVRIDGVCQPLSVAVPNYFHKLDFSRGDAVWIALQGASVINLGVNCEN